MSSFNKNSFNKLIKQLDSIEFFRKFSLKDKAYIHEQGLFESFDDGMFIICEGAEDRTFYVLITGTVRITKNSQPDQPLATLNSGAIFGEIAHFSRQVRSTNVIATGPVIVFRLEHNLFKRLTPEIREKINHETMAVLMKRLENLKKRSN